MAVEEVEVMVTEGEGVGVEEEAMAMEEVVEEVVKVLLEEWEVMIFFDIFILRLIYF